jgi:hypothetical protein
MVDLISHHRAHKRRHEDEPHSEDEARHTPSRRLGPSSEPDYTPVRQAMDGLAFTSAAFLISNSPLTSSSRLPPLQTYEISPDRNQGQILLETTVPTERERLLMATLERRNIQISLQKQVIGGLQAQTILHSAHIEDLRGKLQGNEEKKIRGQDRGRINMDGLPKVLTQDKIFEGVVKAHAERDAAKNAAAKWKDAKKKYTEAVGVWKVREVERKERNGELKSELVKEVKRWEVERNRAKCERSKPRWVKPKAPTMEKPTPKPKVADFEEESEGGSEGDEEMERDEDEEDVEGSRSSDGSDSD